MSPPIQTWGLSQEIHWLSFPEITCFPVLRKQLYSCSCTGLILCGHSFGSFIVVWDEDFGTSHWAAKRCKDSPGLIHGPMSYPFSLHLEREFSYSPLCSALNLSFRIFPLFRIFSLHGAVDMRFFLVKYLAQSFFPWCIICTSIAHEYCSTEYILQVQWEHLRSTCNNSMYYGVIKYKMLVPACQLWVAKIQPHCLQIDPYILSSYLPMRREMIRCVLCITKHLSFN